jgi:hypothetical protein
MKRILTLAAVALLSMAAPAFADAGAPYKLDTKGKCHDAKGAFVTADKCKPAAAVKPAKCRDAKGKFAKCGTPGAKPA